MRGEFGQIVEKNFSTVDNRVQRGVAGGQAQSGQAQGGQAQSGQAQIGWPARVAAP